MRSVPHTEESLSNLEEFINGKRIPTTMEQARIFLPGAKWVEENKDALVAKGATEIRYGLCIHNSPETVPVFHADLGRFNRPPKMIAMEAGLARPYGEIVQMAVYPDQNGYMCTESFLTADASPRQIWDAFHLNSIIGIYDGHIPILDTDGRSPLDGAIDGAIIVADLSHLDELVKELENLQAHQTVVTRETKLM